jgi:hypothetical protein
MFKMEPAAAAERADRSMARSFQWDPQSRIRWTVAPAIHRSNRAGHASEPHKNRGDGGVIVEVTGRATALTGGSGARMGGPGKLSKMALNNGRSADTRRAMSQTLYLHAALCERSNLRASQAAASTSSICQLQVSGRRARLRDRSTI